MALIAFDAVIAVVAVAVVAAAAMATVVRVVVHSAAGAVGAADEIVEQCVGYCSSIVWLRLLLTTLARLFGLPHLRPWWELNIPVPYAACKNQES